MPAPSQAPSPVADAAIISREIGKPDSNAGNANAALVVVGCDALRNGAGEGWRCRGISKRTTGRTPMMALVRQ